jgi:hypothetical protein
MCRIAARGKGLLSLSSSLCISTLGRWQDANRRLDGSTLARQKARSRVRFVPRHPYRQYSAQLNCGALDAVYGGSKYDLLP